MGGEGYLIESEGPDVQTVSLFHSFYLLKIFLHCFILNVIWCSWEGYERSRREGEGGGGRGGRSGGVEKLSTIESYQHDN